MQRTNDIDVKIEEGKFIAERIEGAKFVEFAGEDHLFWAGNTIEVLDEIQEFIQELPPCDGCHKQRLSTLFFGQIMTASTGSLRTQKIDELINQYGGVVLEKDKKICRIAFDIPSKAIHFGMKVLTEVKTQNAAFSAGIYMRESDINYSDSVLPRDSYMMTSILSLIRPNKILVTQAIKHLLSGVDYNFIKDASILSYKTNDLCTLYTVTKKTETNESDMNPYGFTRYDSFLEEVLQVIDQHIDDSSFGVEKLTQVMNMSERKLQRKIKDSTGKSPTQLIMFVRLDHSKKALISHKYSVSEIAFKFGFSSPSYFSKCFKKEFGIRPTEV